MRVEEDPVLEKMEKKKEVDDDLLKGEGLKQKKQKKKSSEGFDINAALTEVTDKTIRGEKHKKEKRMKNDHVGEIVVDRVHDDGHDKANMEVDDDVKKDKDRKGLKQKKQKKKSSEGFDIDAALTEVTDKTTRGEKHKKEKKKKNDHGGEIVVDRVRDDGHDKANLEVDDEVKKDKDRKKKRKSKKNSEEAITEMRNSEEFAKGKKFEDGESRVLSEAGTVEKMEEKNKRKREKKKDSEAGTVEKMENKKRKREKKKENNGLDAVSPESVKEGKRLPENDFFNGEDKEGSKGRKKKKTYAPENSSEDPQLKRKSKTKDGEDKEGGQRRKKKKTNAPENSSEDPQPKRKSKKVSFSNDVEVFPSVVQGKRFSKEEDEIVKKAVLDYINDHGLGEDGLNMVMHCGSYPEVKNCWKEIGAAIPYRPVAATYYRAHILFERSAKRKWTQEEIDFLRKYQKEHGNDWKSIAEELGKHRFHVKDTWRRVKLVNLKRGRWTQEEYQNLYDLVNLDLKIKMDAEEKQSKHGMLRDNIPWGAISDKLSTRTDASCCEKWYSQLTSSMVGQGLWVDADDYRLVGALYDLDACCEGDVDWDSLLEHRSGDVCRKRWNQMVLHIGHHGSKPFAEQVEILAQRYCPDLAETREAWDSKPVVP